MGGQGCRADSWEQVVMLTRFHLVLFFSFRRWRRDNTVNLARRVGKDAHPTKSGARVLERFEFWVVEEQKVVVNDEFQRWCGGTG